MSAFYAKFKETDRELLEFPTEKARDEWVNFQDDFSVAAGNTVETATFQREAISQQQAFHLMRAHMLIVRPEHSITTLGNYTLYTAYA